MLNCSTEMSSFHDERLYGQGHAAARPSFEAILAQADGVLHPMHVTVVDTLMPLVNCCRAAGAQPNSHSHAS